MTHIAVVGLESKSAFVDFITSKTGYDYVVRFDSSSYKNEFVSVGSKMHCFDQFGSGTFNNVPTYLSVEVIVDLEDLSVESSFLNKLGIQDSLSLMNISDQCKLITPWHRQLARAKHITPIDEVRSYAVISPAFAPRVRDLFLSPSAFRGLMKRFLSYSNSQNLGHWPTRGKMFDDFIEVYHKKSLEILDLLHVVSTEQESKIMHSDSLLFESARIDAEAFEEVSKLLAYHDVKDDFLKFVISECSPVIGNSYYHDLGIEVAVATHGSNQKPFFGDALDKVLRVK